MDDQKKEGLSLDGMSDRLITVLPVLAYAVNLLNKMLAIIGSYLGMNLGG